VGVLSDFVLRDPARVGDALSLAFVLLSPIGILLFLAGAREMRKMGASAMTKSSEDPVGRAGVAA